MLIACPECDESYRIEPGRMAGRRVRAACLACGEALYLRVIDVTEQPPSPVAGVGGEVPLWREPQPVELEAEAPSVAEAEEVQPEEVETPAAGVAAPTAPPALEPAFEPYVSPEAAPSAEPSPEPFLEPEPAGAETWPEPHAEPEAPAQADRPVQAFTFSRVGDVSARAQRLARALVSDILVYHPRKIEQGIREGNLKELMQEEVEKSWDEYCERLGVEVARANRGHFLAALNEILARGKPLF